MSKSTVAEKQPIIHKQHLVSKTVLKRFASADDKKITVHYLDRCRIKSVKPENEAYVRDYIKIDSNESEARWQVIENKAPIIHEALSNGSLKLEEWDEACIPTILELISLHIVRSHSTLSLWKRDLESSPWVKAKEAWRADGELMRAYMRESNRSYIPISERMLLIADFARGLQSNLQPGEEGFRDFIHKMQEKIETYLKDMTIEVGRAPDGKEFLIGDTPAVLRDSSSGKQGVLEGVGVTGANELFFPLDRRHVIGVLSPNKRQPSIIQLTPQQVDRINLLQLKNAERKVFYHPQSNLTEWVHSVVDHALVAMV